MVKNKVRDGVCILTECCCMVFLNKIVIDEARGCGSSVGLVVFCGRPWYVEVIV